MPPASDGLEGADRHHLAQRPRPASCQGAWASKAGPDKHHTIAAQPMTHPALAPAISRCLMTMGCTRRRQSRKVCRSIPTAPPLPRGYDPPGSTQEPEADAPAHHRCPSPRPVRRAANPGDPDRLFPSNSPLRCRRQTRIRTPQPIPSHNELMVVAAGIRRCAGYEVIFRVDFNPIQSAHEPDQAVLRIGVRKVAPTSPW